MENEQNRTMKTALYNCEVGQYVTIIGPLSFFGICVPPGDMLMIADFILTHHRARLEQQQREIDQQHEALVKEVRALCALREKSFDTLSSWDFTDLMRELAGMVGPCDEWDPLECLSPAGHWYRTVCCNPWGSIYSHVWEPFFMAACQQQQPQDEEET